MTKMRIVPAEASDEMVDDDTNIVVGCCVPNEAHKRELYTAMLAAAPHAGKIPRQKLREAHKAACRAGMEAWRKARPGEGHKAEDSAFLDALAAALGLEVEE